jgi:hypothetical protein
LRAAGDPRLIVLVRKASNALFTLGHVSLETGQVLDERVLKLIQALTIPTMLQQHSTALSPKLAQGFVSPSLTLHWSNDWTNRPAQCQSAPWCA